jgi:hypothetical protein
MADNPKKIEASDLSWIGQYILDDQGNPVPERDLLKWATWMEDSEHCHFLKTDLGPLGWISTIFLGVDHDFFSLNEEQTHCPILWETMVFGGPYDQEQRRYRSREDALQGHAELVAMCRQAGKNGRIFYWWFVEWLKYGEILFGFLMRKVWKSVRRSKN